MAHMGHAPNPAAAHCCKLQAQLSTLGEMVDMKCKALLMSAFAYGSLFAASAHAMTYTGVRTLDGGTADISITTDGKIGVLATDDITAFSLTLTDALGTTSFSQVDGSWGVFGAGLTASAADLSFDFDATDGSFVEFQDTVPNGYYCIQTAPCAFTGGPGEGFNSQSLNFADAQSLRSGEVIIATASAVPEPGAWALLVVGLGAVGAAIRFARQTSLALRAAP
jgi:hypothetical protein